MNLENIMLNKPVTKGHIIFGQGFPGGAVVGSPSANAGHMGSSPGPGGSHMPQSN